MAKLRGREAKIYKGSIEELLNAEQKQRLDDLLPHPMKARSETVLKKDCRFDNLNGA